MSASNILSYIFTSISFLSVLFSIFNNNHQIISVSILVPLAILSFLFLVIYLRKNQNKLHTLHVLSKENRGLAVQLLLTYEQLKYSKDTFSERFSTTKIHTNNANYFYEITPSEDSSKIDNLKCIFTFQIRKAPKDGVFDILIAQPRGMSIKTIKYKFDDSEKEYTTYVREISQAKNKKDSPRLLRAKITLNNGQKCIKTLIVSYTLENAYSIHNGAFLLCPFIYAKKVNRFDVQIKYPNEQKYLFNNVCLKVYPYNGRRFQPQKIANFL